MTLPAGVRDVRRVGGGDINEAFHVVLADGGEAFVKTRPDAAGFGSLGGSDGAGFGSLRLSNEPAGDWPSFYAERRLRPLARIARDRGVLPASALEAVGRLLWGGGRACRGAIRELSPPPAR